MAKLKKAIILALTVSMFSLAALGSGSRGGDGKTSCKNCGRSPVYVAGFCKSCWDSFEKWQDKQNGK